MPRGIGKPESNGPLRCVWPEYLVKNGLEEKGPKRIQNTDGSEKQDTWQPFEPIGQPKAHKTEKSLHALRTTFVVQILSKACLRCLPEPICILYLLTEVTPRRKRRRYLLHQWPGSSRRAKSERERTF